MAGVEKKYTAKVGLNFDGLKDKPRVEVGERIPDNVSDSEIKQLLRDGAIEESKPKAKK